MSWVVAVSYSKKREEKSARTLCAEMNGMAARQLSEGEVSVAFRRMYPYLKGASLNSVGKLAWVVPDIPSVHHAVGLAAKSGFGGKTSTPKTAEVLSGMQ